MYDVIAGMTGPQLIGLVAVAGGLVSLTVVSVAGVLVPALAQARRAESLDRLKRDLVAAGYKPDEVERVVKATPDK